MKKIAKRLRRAFTITELVIVIAVIAILAAVLIPTFIYVVDRANQSVDVQAARQMNVSLAAREAESDFDNISDVIKALDEENMELDNYKPITKDCYFYWVKSLNRVVYTDASYNVIYPEEYESIIKTAGDWYTLSGDIPLDDGWMDAVSGNAVSIGSGAQFASFLKSYAGKNSTARSVRTVTLTADVDLAGATYKLRGTTSDPSIEASLTIDGGNHTISGLRDDSNSFFGSGDFSSKGYGYGLISVVGANTTVTIENVTISGMVVDDTSFETGTVGLIAGYVYGTLNLENVTIKDSYVCGNQKIGGIAGRVNGTLNMKNVKTENVVVAGTYQTAKVTGYADIKGNCTVTYDNCDFSGITVTETDDPTAMEYFEVWSATEGILATMNGTEAYYINTRYGLCLSYSQALCIYPDTCITVTVNGKSYSLDSGSFFTNGPITSGTVSDVNK